MYSKKHGLSTCASSMVQGCFFVAAPTAKSAFKFNCRLCFQKCVKSNSKEKRKFEGAGRDLITSNLYFCYSTAVERSL
jgi:hypothetical protein